MFERAPTLVKPVREFPVQAFYSDGIQLFDLMEALLYMLDKKCPAMYITSFSASEEFIRRIFRFRRDMSIDHVALFLDSRAAVKIAPLLPFARNVFDAVYLTNNHGKVILFDAVPRISVCTSQNQTRGNRREATLITTDTGCYDAFFSEIQWAYYLGKAQTTYEIRRQEVELAKTGSPMAVELVSDYLIEQSQYEL